MWKYDDIVDLPHHVSARRQHLPPESRAAQFAPFAALSGYEEAVAEEARLTARRVDLSPEESDELARRLAYLLTVGKEQEITVTYFVADLQKAGGQYLTHTGRIRRIDSTEGLIQFEDRTSISIKDICDISGEIFNDPQRFV